jgi:cytochrome d ubiquinol oxidase subunit II
LFCFAVGVFTGVLFAFLAAVYLVGETQDPDIKRIFARRALILNVLAVVVGIAVFITAELEGLPLARLFFGSKVSLGAMMVATALLAPLWIAIRRDAVQAARLLVAAQVGVVLIGWYRLQYPVVVNSPAQPLTIYAAAAPEPTLRYLLYALAVGALVIFPALIYLLKIFKLRETESPDSLVK